LTQCNARQFGGGGGQQALDQRKKFLKLIQDITTELGGSRIGFTISQSIKRDQELATYLTFQTAL
jgi:hypothetical protein